MNSQMTRLAFAGKCGSCSRERANGLRLLGPEQVGEREHAEAAAGAGEELAPRAVRELSAARRTSGGGGAWWVLLEPGA